MKKIFSVKAQNASSGSIYFSWQKYQGNYLAVNDNCSIRVYDKRGQEVEHFQLPDTCTGFGWSRDGNILASVCAKNGVVWLWQVLKQSISHVETGFRDKDTLTFMLWSKGSEVLAVGTLKGNLFLYDHQSGRRMPILGKHTKRIHCGAWSMQNLLALGSDDRSISISNQNGDTLKNLHNIEGDVSDVQFNSVKTDQSDSKEKDENTVSFVKKGRILSFYSFDTEKAAMEVVFNELYGTIAAYSWYGDGYICIGFSNGYYVVISTHVKEIGKELFHIQDFRYNLHNLAICPSNHMAAVVGDSGVRFHHVMQPEQQWTPIPLQRFHANQRNQDNKNDDYYYQNDQNGGFKLERVRWSEDGHLVAISSSGSGSSTSGTGSTTSGSGLATVHVMLAQLPVVGGCDGSVVAVMTSLNEVTIQDPVYQTRPQAYTVDIEASFVAISHTNLVLGMNNIAIYYVITGEGLLKLGKHEYLGSVESIQVNRGFYVSALFDGRVTLHKVNSQEDDHTKDMITFPDKEQRNKEERITGYQLTDHLFIYATNKGNLHFFHLEDWMPICSHHHSSPIHHLGGNSLGTKMVVVDGRGKVFLFDSVDERKLDVPECFSKIEGVLWDSWPGDRDVFIVFDKVRIKVYRHVRNHLKGQRVELVGECVLGYGQTPLLLYAGNLTVILNTGGIKTFCLDTHPSFARDGELSVDENKKNLTKLLKLGRLGQAHQICKGLGEVDEWERLGVLAIESMDVETAIKAYRGKGDVAMVMILQEFLLIEDRPLLQGHLNCVMGDFEAAQESFLQSSRPVAALEMRRDLMHWQQVLSLADKYAPQDIPFISKEYAQQLEFTAQYSASLQHYKQAIVSPKGKNKTNKNNKKGKEIGGGGDGNSVKGGGGVDDDDGDDDDDNVRKHNKACVAGVARMTIRTGDIRKGLEVALKELSKDECKECALIMENMKQFPEAALLYEKSGFYDSAATAYIRAKNWSKVADLLKKTSLNQVHTQYAKAQEELKRNEEAASAYESGKDWESAIRIHLEHFKNPTEAARLVKEGNSIEGAKMVAKFFETSGDFESAIQFLVFSKCNNEAFRLAQKHGHMLQYADIIGEDASPEDLRSMSVHFGNEGNHFLAGKFAFLSGDHSKAIELLLNEENKENHAAISLAVQVAGQASNQLITDRVISYLMGEVDDYPKDPKYLFQLHLMQNKHKEAAAIAIIIAREQQNEGSYRVAHKLLFEMFVELREHKLKVPFEMESSLTLLHSYVLAKLQIKLGEHTKAARLLIRISNSISKFPQHTVQILTSTVIECQRSGLKNSAFNFAVMLLKPGTKDQIDAKYRKKIESIVRKPDRTEVEEATSPCPFCQHHLPNSHLTCPSCKSNIPFCIASGSHIIKDQTTRCPHCHFPAIIQEISSLLSGDDSSCPMCGVEVDVMMMTKSPCAMSELIHSYE